MLAVFLALLTAAPDEPRYESELTEVTSGPVEWVALLKAGDRLRLGLEGGKWLETGPEALLLVDGKMVTARAAAAEVAEFRRHTARLTVRDGRVLVAAFFLKGAALRQRPPPAERPGGDDVEAPPQRPREEQPRRRASAPVPKPAPDKSGNLNDPGGDGTGAEEGPAPPAPPAQRRPPSPRRTETPAPPPPAVAAAPVPPPSPGPPPVAPRTPDAGRLVLLSPAADARYRAMMPPSEDGALERFRDDPAVVFYDEEAMPSAYQDWATLPGGGTPLWGVHLSSHNKVANGRELFGNANMEFPWRRPAGLTVGDNASAFKFVKFPPGEGAPIKWRRQTFEGDFRPDLTYVWEYADGTTFGEALVVHKPLALGGGLGAGKVFEVRTRTKAGPGRWNVNVYRPFPTHNDLLARLEKGPRLAGDFLASDVSTLAEALREPKLELMQLLGGHSLRTSFARLGTIESLPPVGPALVDALLSEKFRRVGSVAWRHADRADVHAPRATNDYHIVPRGYQGTWLPADSVSCMTCHESVLKAAQDFEPLSRREWYGRVRGSDNIFSFHIFDPATISPDGRPREPSLRQELVRAGLLKEVQ